MKVWFLALHKFRHITGLRDERVGERKKQVMDSPERSEKTNRIKSIQRKNPAELKSMINLLYSDAAIKDIDKFQEDMLNFEKLDTYWTSTLSG